MDTESILRLFRLQRAVLNQRRSQNVYECDDIETMFRSNLMVLERGFVIPGMTLLRRNVKSGKRVLKDTDDDNLVVDRQVFIHTELEPRIRNDCITAFGGTWLTLEQFFPLRLKISYGGESLELTGTDATLFTDLLPRLVLSVTQHPKTFNQPPPSDSQEIEQHVKKYAFLLGQSLIETESAGHDIEAIISSEIFRWIMLDRKGCATVKVCLSCDDHQKVAHSNTIEALSLAFSVFLRRGLTCPLVFCPGLFEAVNLIIDTRKSQGVNRILPSTLITMIENSLIYRARLVNRVTVLNEGFIWKTLWEILQPLAGRRDQLVFQFTHNVSELREDFDEDTLHILLPCAERKVTRNFNVTALKEFLLEIQGDRVVKRALPWLLFRLPDTIQVEKGIEDGHEDNRAAVRLLLHAEPFKSGLISDVRAELIRSWPQEADGNDLEIGDEAKMSPVSTPLKEKWPINAERLRKGKTLALKLSNSSTARAEPKASVINPPAAQAFVTHQKKTKNLPKEKRNSVPTEVRREEEKCSSCFSCGENTKFGIYDIVVIEQLTYTNE